jgi:glycosyltransferase involved in cell wall biosynthesis
MSIPPGGVWLDARGTQSIQHAGRGIGRYIAEHIGALLELAPDQVGAIGVDPQVPVPGTLEELAGPEKLKPQGRARPVGTRLPAIYHVMSPFERALELDDIWPAWARRNEVRTAVTLYDLVPLVLRESYLNGSMWGHWGTLWMARLGLIRSADQVLTISERTANDAAEHLNIPEERITVIESGVSDELSSLVGSPAEADSLLRSLTRRIRPGFLLYVGGDEPRKNLEGTIRAYAQLPGALRGGHQLVIACRMGHLRRAQLMTFARRLGIARRELVLTGFVPDRELAALYRRCALFVFPSLYEGAGLPILEAMSCGAPVAASNSSSIPEILGDLDATFDPTDPAEIAHCLRRVLESPSELEALRRRSHDRVGLFTWKRVAERTLEGYERALDGAGATAVGERRAPPMRPMSTGGR